MFDFHTHILPGIDDGSKSVEESLAMLSMLKEQGADGIAATPHFYAQQRTPAQFFAERQAAFERLKPHLPPDAPAIRLGAEVLYFEGIGRFDGLKDFCLEGTDLLLLEMPFGVWTTRTVSTVLELSKRSDVTVVLAHIDRYLHRQNKKAIRLLLDCGVLAQANTVFFTKNRRRALKMLRDGHIHFLGTDCHNTTTRKPDLAPALAAIDRKGLERPSLKKGEGDAV